jgi:hypothetical protein
VTKIAQSIAQAVLDQNEHKERFIRGNIWAPSVLKKQPKENNRSMGENSPNLATLDIAQTKELCPGGEV